MQPSSCRDERTYRTELQITNISNKNEKKLKALIISIISIDLEQKYQRL